MSDDESYELPSAAVTQAIIDGTAPELARTAAPAPAAAAAAAAAASSAAGKLPPLFEIFQDTEHFRKFVNGVGKQRAQCLWCRKDLPCNATKMLFHVCGVSGKGVSICTAVIPEVHMQRYQDLRKRKEKGKNQRAGESVHPLFVLFIPLLLLIYLL